MKLSETKVSLSEQTNVSETGKQSYGEMNEYEKHLDKIKGRKLPEHEITEIGSGKNFHEKTEQLMGRTKIENTPFEIISEKGKGHYIVMGDYRLTEPSNFIEECFDKIETRDWEFLTTVIGTMIDFVGRVKTMEIEKDLKTQENEH